jgi:hypothetical protein
MHVLSPIRAGSRDIDCGVTTTPQERAVFEARRFPVYRHRGTAEDSRLNATRITELQGTSLRFSTMKQAAHCRGTARVINTARCRV